MIRTDQMCVIGQGSNLTYHALELTPFDELGASTGGTLYVPEALIDTYLANDFWASLFSLSKNSIVAIEGSKYDVG